MFCSMQSIVLVAVNLQVTYLHVIFASDLLPSSSWIYCSSSLSLVPLVIILLSSWWCCEMKEKKIQTLRKTNSISNNPDNNNNNNNNLIWTDNNFSFSFFIRFLISSIFDFAIVLWRCQQDHHHRCCHDCLISQWVKLVRMARKMCHDKHRT